MIFRLAAASLALALMVAMPGAAQQKHWLLGVWDGEMSGLSTRARGGSQRTLRVNAVAPNGSAGKGTYGDGSNTQNVVFSISGDSVSFSTPGYAGFDHRLTHRAGVLEGTWSNRSTGASGPVRFKKK